MDLGRVGVWAGLEAMNAGAAADFATRVEAMGYRTLWIPEGMGRDPFVLAGYVLGRTTKLVMATGIANIYARDAVAMSSATKTLCEAYPSRFVLGIGVSHVPLVVGVRHHEYRKPIETMAGYLEAMREAPYMAPMPASTTTVLAALGPRMLKLASEAADGVHPYNVTPEHTAKARAILGPGKLLCPEQAVLFETDAAKARAVARNMLQFYMTLENYTNNWRRMGFETPDFEGGGSDRLIDAVIAWGDEAAIRARIEAHLSAGADHVAIQALSRSGQITAIDEEALGTLARR